MLTFTPLQNSCLIIYKKKKKNAVAATDKFCNLRAVSFCSLQATKTFLKIKPKRGKIKGLTTGPTSPEIPGSPTSPFSPSIPAPPLLPWVPWSPFCPLYPTAPDNPGGPISP